MTSTTDVMFNSLAESFSDLPSPIREETTNSTLIPDSMIISNWVRNVDLGERYLSQTAYCILVCSFSA